MAYVSISNGLLDSTRVNIRNMRDKEKALHTVPAESCTVPDNDGNMTALIWGNHQHLRDQMPEDWKINPGKITLRIAYKLDPEAEKDYNVDFQVAATAGFPCPRTEQSNSSYYGYITKVNENSYLLPQGAKELVAHRKVMREIDTRWEAVTDKVRQFLNSAKSLNEALKLWPGLSLYINQDYLDRVAEKANGVKREKPKTSAEELLGTLDVDTLTAAAVASKLTV